MQVIALPTKTRELSPIASNAEELIRVNSNTKAIKKPNPPTTKPGIGEADSLIIETEVILGIE